MTAFTTGLGRCLSKLSVRERTASAAEQATLDWRYESAASKSLIHQALSFTRFVFALSRISVRVAAGDVLEAVSLGWAARLALWIAVVTWVSFSPALPSRDQANAENVVRFWFALSGALVMSPALAVLTARSSGRAPIVGLALLSMVGVTAIYRLALPFAGAGLREFSVDVRTEFLVITWIALILMIGIAEGARTDHRRWVVNSVLAASVIFPMVAANAVKIATWMGDVGVISGDVVYLPRIPTAVIAVFSQGPWPMIALLAIVLTWLVARRWRRELL